MKYRKFIFIFCYFAFFLNAKAVTVWLTNGNTFPVLVSFSGPDTNVIVPSSSTLRFDTPEGGFWTSDAGLLRFDLYVTNADATVEIGYLEIFGQPAEETYFAFVGSGSGDGYILHYADGSRVNWSMAWRVFALGCGCMVVPAGLSMALRAVRRGLTHNVSPS